MAESAPAPTPTLVKLFIAAVSVGAAVLLFASLYVSLETAVEAGCATFLLVMGVGGVLAIPDSLDSVGELEASSRGTSRTPDPPPK